MVTFPGWRELVRRLPRLLAGVAALGGGIALMVRARLGLSPWDVLHQGISNKTGIDFGTVVVVVGVAVLLSWIPLRQRPGLGTLVNTLLVGAFADLALRLLPRLTTMPWRVPSLLGGVLIVGLGTGAYLGAGLGPGPRDGLMTAISDRGFPIWGVRTVIELSALALGWALGGNVGVGTVLFAFSIGPLAHLSIRWFRVGPQQVDAGPGLSGE